MQKSAGNENQIIEKMNYSVSQDFFVTKAKGNSKVINFNLKESLKEDENKFEGRIQAIIENKFNKPSNNMTI